MERERERERGPKNLCCGRVDNLILLTLLSKMSNSHTNESKQYSPQSKTKKNGYIKGTASERERKNPED
jgi:hypothetical protein